MFHIVQFIVQIKAVYTVKSLKCWVISFTLSRNLKKVDHVKTFIAPSHGILGKFVTPANPVCHIRSHDGKGKYY